ncbi:response regulator [Fulvivirga lutea]|uniref:Response regulator n=1 Tax=Fulvivirga lutea TaxID=2810512 RepID=A0A974WFM9_9BACT|nr:response regulator [Fulvivirga lutea]QSE97588.1 response regulator [Fulvivirga lutea]
MRKVLVVEDGLIIALHLQKLLDNHGYKVIGKLKYGEEVEQVVKEQEPDLLILDIMLEGEMSGIESASIIRKFSNVPIIFMSALTDPETLKDVSYISNSIKLNKPFEEDILLKTVADMLT